MVNNAETKDSEQVRRVSPVRIKGMIRFNSCLGQATEVFVSRENFMNVRSMIVTHMIDGKVR